MSSDDERRKTHSQSALARLQLSSLRSQLEGLRERARSTPDAFGVGDVLTAVMVGGFALELGLKLFYMSYSENKAHGHDLAELFKNLPQKIQNDISASFAHSNSKSLIQVYAFVFSEQQPSTTPHHEASKYDSAENVINASKNSFVKARYFFEQLNDQSWSSIDDASQYMLDLCLDLEAVYDEYVRRGGWGDAYFID